MKNELLRVKSIPSVSSIGGHESGIKRVIEAYTRYSEKCGFTYVDDNYQVVAIHAGMTTRLEFEYPIVSHIHGLYWTSDYLASSWEWQANAKVIASMRHAERITAPSEWVAETVKRDMRVTPTVIYHGIDWREWIHNYPPEPYVLWNKNRVGDVCSPDIVAEIAKEFPEILFRCTFVPQSHPENMVKIGTIPHHKMKILVQRASVYLSTTKETFGIGILEAIASGTPVLGSNHGGNKIIVEHGKTGYLAKPDSVDDFVAGLKYCLMYRETLGAHAKDASKRYGWLDSVKKVGDVYREAYESFQDRRRPFLIPKESYLK